MYLAVGDPDFQMRGGGGASSSFPSKNKEGGPPGPPTLPRSNLPVSFLVSIILKQT